MANSKRKPLSDITNKFNLTPTWALRKLVSASSSNSFPKPPLSNSSSTNLKVFSESSSKSSNSIGSSNVGATLNSKKTVQFRTPTSHGGIGSKDAAHNRRQITEKSKKEREADADVVIIHTPIEKMKDKGKAIAVPLSSTHSENTKDNLNGNEGILKHSRSSNLLIKETGPDMIVSHTPIERRKDKGKAIAAPLSSTPSVKTKDNQNGNEGILKHSRSSNLLIKETGPDMIVSRTPVERRKDKGKAIAVPLSSTPSVKTKDNQNEDEGILKHSRSSNLKIQETGQELLNPPSFLVQRAKDSREPPNTVNSHEKTREKGKEILQPSDIVEIAQNKGSSAVVAAKSVFQPRKSQRRKFDAGASSCPPMKRPKSIENNQKLAGDVISLKSCTDPHLKLRKKTYPRVKKTSELKQDSNDKLPQDFVEQQRAYFKEVDEFELAEEEVSSDELD